MQDTPASDPLSLDKPVDDIKRHVMQIESMVLFVLGFQVIVLFQHQLEVYFEDFWLLAPLAYLALLPLVMRVNNPKYTPRSMLRGALSGIGVGGGIGGGIAGTLTGGLGAPAGALVGAAVGAFLGAFVYPLLDGGTSGNLLQRGDAFDYLYRHRGKKPQVANSRLVDQALDNVIPWFDKNRDRRRWYALEDLEGFLKRPPADGT